MKILLFLLISATVASAQFVTNSITLVLHTNDNQTLMASWNLENNRRTNALPPYAVTNTAITFANYKDAIAGEAFQVFIDRKSQDNRNDAFRLFADAPPAIQAKAIRVLSGKE